MERSSLLPNGISSHHYGATNRDDLEDQKAKTNPRSKFSKLLSRSRDRAVSCIRTAISPKSWDKETIWREGFVKPTGYVPAVILGTLLNILDALSYGMILFPLGQPIFAHLGPDGISIFYVSCIISQLVYSCGGSIFKGGVGSEMIEVVPFFHNMAFTILAEVGDENPKSVLATTILSYAISSIITGLAFFALGACGLGSLIGFFPRHILIGCIGGVGWFLVATGVEVSARLSGNLEYSLATLEKLVQLDTIFLWLTPLLLAIIFEVVQGRIKSTYFMPCYFLLVPAIFHIIVATIPSLHLDQLRTMGWVFERPSDGAAFYHFYTLYDFGAVNWSALVRTIPAMFALTFFGIIHVPINVPALGITAREDNVNVDRELIAHGISNALSGLCGSIQNYLVYANSTFFIKAGGESRVAGVMLAIATSIVLVAGPGLVGYIPITVVGALIFLLGIELMKEALYDPWGKLTRLEYLTVLAIVITMGAYDFVIGIVVGIVLACASYVVQTSRKSAIRASYSGEVAGSTVRRPPVQDRFLREARKQIHLTKLGGFLFFGTIVSVENRIRAFLDEVAFRERPIRYMLFDVNHVTGIDFSAAEGFTKISRLLATKEVKMIISSVHPRDDIGKSLKAVGLLDEGRALTFADLNSALQFCENDLLKVLSHREEHLSRRGVPSKYLDIPRRDVESISIETMFSSPRRSYLQQAAQKTLNDRETMTAPRWDVFSQPVPLIMQTFQDLTNKNEDFWFKATTFFERKYYPAGAVLYRVGDAPNGFFLLEDGILRAEYELPQGQYYESIVAGTTCGELPFFSSTKRTATVIAERDCIAWLMSEVRWEELQREFPEVARELLLVSLKLTTERMSAITSYVMTTAR